MQYAPHGDLTLAFGSACARLSSTTQEDDTVPDYMCTLLEDVRNYRSEEAMPEVPSRVKVIAKMKSMTAPRDG